MGRAGLPDRWLPYTAVGNVIDGTKFVAFKVPLKKELCRNLTENERFTPSSLLTSLPALGFVVDLTNTHRYYNPQVFMSVGLGYQKIYCEGHVLPSNGVVQQFFDTVDNFYQNSTEGSLIGVHCTHGVNRTGYLICKYMIDRLGFDPATAIKCFQDARGHHIERSLYTNTLREIRRDQAPRTPSAIVSFSPLDNCYDELPRELSSHFNRYKVDNRGSGRSKAAYRSYDPRPTPQLSNVGNTPRIRKKPAKTAVFAKNLKLHNVPPTKRWNIHNSTSNTPSHTRWS